MPVFRQCTCTHTSGYVDLLLSVAFNALSPITTMSSLEGRTMEQGVEIPDGRGASPMCTQDWVKEE